MPIYANLRLQIEWNGCSGCLIHLTDIPLTQLNVELKLGHTLWTNHADYERLDGKRDISGRRRPILLDGFKDWVCSLDAPVGSKSPPWHHPRNCSARRI